MNECIFCKIIRRESPAEILYETENTLSFLDINPINLGHVLVVPKLHIEIFHSIPYDLLFELAKATSILSQAIIESLKPDGYNIFSNNGKYAGQTISHFHFHITPRYRGDGIKFKPVVKQYKKDEIQYFGKLIRDKIKNSTEG